MNAIQEYMETTQIISRWMEDANISSSILYVSST